MLSSLHIQNYRTLKDLKIDSLSRVNLISGKNNTGKTALLEAINLYVEEGNTNVIKKLQFSRGEVYDYSDEKALKGFYEPLFSQQLKGDHNDYFLSIGPSLNPKLEEILEIRLVPLFKVELSRGDLTPEYIWAPLEENNLKQSTVSRLGFEIRFNNHHRSLLLTDIEDYPFDGSLHGNVNFLSSQDISIDSNSNLWDNITLTDKEVFIIESLKSIEPNIERLNFVNNYVSEKRVAVVRLKNQKKIIPLKSMGDGINRILSISLSLVSADNGYLLIDEFENGLHYTVQKDLWKIVFKLAEELNVQVFATTHSNDCIRAFENVLNSEANQDKGQFLRLDKIKEDIIATPYTASELKTATEHFIEVR